jgi:hypothetical protein
MESEDPSSLTRGIRPECSFAFALRFACHLEFEGIEKQKMADDRKVEHLIAEYSEPFASFDDLTLGRWLAQTLSQLKGKAWRMSHPLIHSYRFAAKLGHQRQVWLKRLANVPPEFPPAKCCRAPLFPILSRDLLSSGLICLHCEETAFELEDLPSSLAEELKLWAEDYNKLHHVAHWEEQEQKEAGDYEAAFEEAKKNAASMLARMQRQFLPALLEELPALAWEDQDECLEIPPEDIGG